ncbi:MAG: hypothetical protein NTX79_05955 [Candidatus Micrarchaeota archaeon]|nr:hypothetical protein [Candidatus Micrarchaeota archaeon]
MEDEVVIRNRQDLPKMLGCLLLGVLIIAVLVSLTISIARSNIWFDVALLL